MSEMKQPLLQVKDLTVEYQTDESVAKAVNHVSLSVNRKETIGLVGETGAGKTTLAMTLMGLLPKGIGKVMSGEVLLRARIFEVAQRRHDGLPR